MNMGISAMWNANSLVGFWTQVTVSISYGVIWLMILSNIQKDVVKTYQNQLTEIFVYIL